MQTMSGQVVLARVEDEADQQVEHEDAGDDRRYDPADMAVLLAKSGRDAEDGGDEPRECEEVDGDAHERVVALLGMRELLVVGVLTPDPHQRLLTLMITHENM